MSDDLYRFKKACYYFFVLLKKVSKQALCTIMLKKSQAVHT